MIIRGIKAAALNQKTHAKINLHGFFDLKRIRII